MPRRLPTGDAVLPLLTLALFVLMFIAWPLADMGVVDRPFLAMMLLIVLLSGLFTLELSARWTRTVVGLGLLVFSCQVGLLFIQQSYVLEIINSMAASIFISILSVLILNNVMGPGRVSLNRIIGAVAIYLLFSLLFAILFDLVEHIWPGAFNMGPDASVLPPAGARFFYLSVITITSVGFGDLAPIHPIARSLVMLEAVLGQIYTTVLLARLVSLEIAGRSLHGSS